MFNIALRAKRTVVPAFNNGRSHVLCRIVSAYFCQVGVIIPVAHWRTLDACVQPCRDIFSVLASQGERTGVGKRCCWEMPCATN